MEFQQPQLPPRKATLEVNGSFVKEYSPKRKLGVGILEVPSQATFSWDFGEDDNCSNEERQVEQLMMERRGGLRNKRNPSVSESVGSSLKSILEE